MSRPLAFVLNILLWAHFHALQADALVVPPRGSIISAMNQTEDLSNPNLSLPKASSNPSLRPSQNIISYHVPNSPTTLSFHSFGATIPNDELLRADAFAVGIAVEHIGERKGDKPIATGIFIYTHEFLNDNEVKFTIADFREVGRAMTYYVLCDVLRGIGEFVLFRGQGAQELDFEVDVDNLGYVGTGHVDYKPAATPTLSVA